MQWSCDGRGGAQRPVWRVNESKKTVASSARARMPGQNPLVVSGKKFLRYRQIILLSYIFWLFCKANFFCGIPFRSKLRKWLFRGTWKASEWELTSAVYGKPFQVYSAEFFGTKYRSQPYTCLCSIDTSRSSKSFCCAATSRCSSGPCCVATSRSITGSCCPGKSKCSWGPCGFDIFRCSKGLCSVDTSRCSSGFFVHTVQFFQQICYYLFYFLLPGGIWVWPWSTVRMGFRTRKCTEFREISPWLFIGKRLFVVQFLQKYCEIGSAWSGVDLRTEVLSIMAPFVPISSIEKGILPELFSLSLLRVSLAKPMWEEAFLWPRAVSDLCYEARAQVKEPRVKNICIVHKWTKNHRSLLEGGEWWARKLASFPPNI